MESDLADIFLMVLNESFNKDPSAIRCLFENKIPCNSNLASCDRILVQKVDNLTNNENFAVTPLGIINGLLSSISGEKICMVYVDLDNGTKELIGFRKMENKNENNTRT